jgi:hypothetical protein
MVARVRLLVVAVLAVVLVGLLPVAGWGVGRLVVGLMVGWCR